MYVIYLFITYIVTSKPKRISCAVGFVHICFSFQVLFKHIRKEKAYVFSLKTTSDNQEQKSLCVRDFASLDQDVFAYYNLMLLDIVYLI